METLNIAIPENYLDIVKILPSVVSSLTNWSIIIITFHEIISNLCFCERKKYV